MRNSPRNPATIGLLAVIVLVFALQVAAGGGQLWHVDLHTAVLLGGNIRRGTSSPDLWRFVMAGLLHAGLLHIAMNGWGLWLLGSMLERLVGGGWMLTIFTTAVVGGNALSWTRLSSHTVALGASGGIFGLLAAAVLFAWLAPEVARLSRSEVTQWLVFGMAIGLVAGFDNWAHLGGVLAGAALGLVLVKLTKSAASRPTKTTQLRGVGTVIGALCAALLVIAAGYAVHNFVNATEASSIQA